MMHIFHALLRTFSLQLSKQIHAMEILAKEKIAHWVERLWNRRVECNCKGGSTIQQTKQNNAGVDRSEKGKDSRADGKYHSKTKSKMMWKLAEIFLDGWQSDDSDFWDKKLKRWICWYWNIKDDPLQVDYEIEMRFNKYSFTLTFLLHWALKLDFLTHEGHQIDKQIH